jgi:hypothetical protein
VSPDCIDGDYAPTGSFAACRWIKPAGTVSGDHVLDSNDGSIGAVVDGWGMFVDASSRFGFFVDGSGGTGGATVLRSTTTWRAGNWYWWCVTYDTSTNDMSPMINGVADAGTATATDDPPTSATDFFLIQSTGSNLTSWEFDEFVFRGDGLPADTSLRRIGACGMDRAECVCSGAGYTDTGNHTTDGGPISGTLPDCNQTSP